MKIAALFSGGKDSTYSIHKAQKDHEVKCLLTVSPSSVESELLHYPNINLTKLQAESMNIPQLYAESNYDTQNQIDTLKKLLHTAIDEYSIEGIVHGGILSEFQKKHFDDLCSTYDLALISPIWNNNAKQYMKSLIDSNFHFMLTSVTCDGLDDSWLGVDITKLELEKLELLSEKFGFNLNFEGGEAETLVTDCPLFSYPLLITNSRKIWDGYRGRFEILEANLDYNAR